MPVNTGIQEGLRAPHWTPAFAGETVRRIIGVYENYARTQSSRRTVLMTPKRSNSPIAKGLGLGLGVGLLGIALYLTPFGWGLEEQFGLAWLFQLRGARTPPSEVVIVAIDEASTTELGLPAEPGGWPRHWHTKLVEQLSAAGARVIAFDLFFTQPKVPEDVLALAEAFRKAGNVVLVEFFTTHALDPSGSQADGAIEMHTPPLPHLADAAVGVASFALPKFPERVNGYWTFKETRDGIVPALPLLAFQHYAAPVYSTFLDHLSEAERHNAETFPANATTRERIIALREKLTKNPALLSKALQAATRIPEPHDARIIRTLLQTYGGADALYLDFYGPPRHITTIPYHEALRPENARAFAGKIVCVGLSESVQIKKKGDTFHTVFTQPNGLELSGVEILATAIANLVEDRPVRPPGLAFDAGIIFLWGLGIGLVCRMATTRAAAGIGLVLIIIYLGIAQVSFTAKSVWLPLVLPLVVQAPAAFFLANVGKYQWIRRLLEYFLSKRGVEEVIRGTTAHDVYGLCLATDIEGYTAIAERMGPDCVRRMLNAYHASVFPLVEQAGGFISDILGDALLAIWHGVSPDLELRASACAAVLDIADALEAFNQTHLYPPLNTRFGLHAGQFSLGVIGAPPHLEYRATGDVVNTASRLEGLNKVLGTRILLSAETMAGLGDDFVTREVGEFLLAGKSIPMNIQELLGRRTEITLDQELLCNAFTEALAAYRAQDWARARQAFLDILKIFSEDGPTRFYLARLERDRISSEGTIWDGVIRIESK
jgi:adenylate cyclase